MNSNTRAGCSTTPRSDRWPTIWILAVTGTATSAGLASRSSAALRLTGCARLLRCSADLCTHKRHRLILIAVRTAALSTSDTSPVFHSSVASPSRATFKEPHNASWTLEPWRQAATHPCLPSDVAYSCKIACKSPDLTGSERKYLAEPEENVSPTSVPTFGSQRTHPDRAGPHSHHPATRQRGSPNGWSKRQNSTSASPRRAREGRNSPTPGDTLRHSGCPATRRKGLVRHHSTPHD